MFQDKIPSRQLGAWLGAGLIPVAIALGSKAGWALAGLIALACAAGTWAVWRWGRLQGRGRCGAVYITVALTAGMVAARAEGAWPGGEGPWVPAILLALAAWSAGKGPSAAARVGCVLFWVVLLLYLAIFGVAAEDVRLEWMAPSGGVGWDLPMLLLAPAVAKVLLRRGDNWLARLALPGAFAVGGAALAAGILSPAVACQLADPFFEMTKSLELLGMTKRFEALVCAGVSVGWFALLSLYLSVCGALAEQILEGAGRYGVWAAAAAAGIWVLCDLTISAGVFAMIAPIFWVILPLLGQVMDREKKS